MVSKIKYLKLNFYIEKANSLSLIPFQKGVF